MTTLEDTIKNSTSKMISPHCIVGNIYHDAVVLYLHSAWSALLDEILCYRATHTRVANVVAHHDELLTK